MNELQIHTLLEQAAQFRDDDKPLHAIQLLQQVIAAHPTCERAFMLLAQIYYDANRMDAAEKVLLQGLQANPRSAEFYMQLGSFHLRQFNYERALEYFLSIRHLHYPLVHMSLGLTYAGLEKLVEAERELKLAAQVDPKLPRVFEVWGEVLLRLNRTHEAINVLKHAARLDRYSGSAHRLLGNALAADERWQAAYDEYLLAVDMNPDDEEAWLSIATTLIHLNRPAEAKRYFERYLKMKPSDTRAVTAYRSVCTFLDEPEKPKASWRKPKRSRTHPDKN